MRLIRELDGFSVFVPLFGGASYTCKYKVNGDVRRVFFI